MEQIIQVDRIEQIIDLFGSFDENIKIVENEYNVAVLNRDSQIKITGEPEGVYSATKAIEALVSILQKGEQLNSQNVRYVISLVQQGQAESVTKLYADCICVTAKGKPVKPKTMGQKAYVDSINKNTITLGIGPAGTGKTYLAVATAVNAFRNKQVNRIILTRPAVEAGEKLGFLPGDMQNKVDPYLRPLYDALFEMMGGETFQKHLERGSIEVAPLAYMRGRTLDESFIILDEAQNTTHEQMKMFLTRLGSGSKAVVNGDITQIDIGEDKKSGLIESEKILAGITDIGICRLTERDVVRHELVQKIIIAYDKYEKKKAASKQPRKYIKR